MRFSLILAFMFSVLFVKATVPVFSQVVPSAEEGSLPFSAGGGYSNYNVDWGGSRMDGGTLWIDYNANFLIPGLGLEAEARDISLNRGSNPQNLREDTAAVGAFYTWRHFRNFRPYGKYLYGLGSVDYANYGGTVPAHATRLVIVPGAGMEYRAYRHVWVRADYEYQLWAKFPTSASPNFLLLPQGFTIGAMYDFRPFHRR